MTEIATRESTALETYMTDPTGGRLVAWAAAATAANQLAKALTTTTFCPQAFKGNPGDATAAILMGDELGLSPLAALRSIYTVHGTPAMYARTMVALAQSQGHQIWTEATSDQRVIVCGKRRGTDKVERAEWTIQRATKAGYTSNKKYGTNPQEMLYAKAAGEIARKIAADVLVGLPFSVEELELEHGVEAGTVTATRSSTTTKRTSRAKAAAPAAPPEPEFDDEAETVDAEPVDDTDAPEDAPITDPQMKKLQAHYNGVDRDVRLQEAADILGHPVESFSSLTKLEASRIIDWIDGPDAEPEP